MKKEDLTEEERIDAEKVKLKRIKAEIRKLNKLFTNLDDKTKKIVRTLIENAAFMAITLDELQETINTEGCVTEYQNGANQWGTKKSPEVEVYNTMIKNHMAVMKQLTDLIPKEFKDDGFESFVIDRD